MFILRYNDIIIQKARRKRHDMDNIEFKLDAEPRDEYDKAIKLLFETDRAIQALTMQERNQLVQEFLKYKGMSHLYQEVQKYFG